MLKLSQRSFCFRCGDTDHHLKVACRETPDELSRCTLTLQNDDSKKAAQAGADLVGLDLWPAAVALCKYLAANPEVVRGLTLLELGAGMGLPGLLAAKLGAQSVLLTDYEPLVLEHLEHNIVANGVAHVCTTCQLDCRQLGKKPSEQLPNQLTSCRLLLAADVLYASVIVQPFVGALQSLLHPEGTALVAHQIRRAITLDPRTRLPRLEDQDEPYVAFLAACTAAGLLVRVLSERQTCSNVDSDPMVLIAVAKGRDALERLPVWQHGGGGGDGHQSGGGNGGNSGD